MFIPIRLTLFSALVMRPSLLVTVASFLTLSLGSVSRSEAQVVFASNKTYAAANVGRSSAPDAKAASSSEKIILMGKITNPAGVLPGAVVILKASRQMAVTNADGEFQFEVPANSGALQAVVTYAGYADEPMTLNAAASQSTVSLTNAKVIVVARRQQLKNYLRTARKQVKRDLKKVHKA
jgi:hypothetical protein